MPTHRTTRFPNGDLSGGICSGTVAIMGNMAFGIIAFAPLGPDHIGQGILAGMFSSIIGGLVASLTGGAPGVISGPKAPTALLFGSLIGQLMATGLFTASKTNDITILLTLAFATVLLSGLIQLVFGITRLGTLVKFIPYPVIAAIRNCTALLIMEGQLSGCLGVHADSFPELLAHITDVQPMTLAVATLTALLAWKGDRLVHKAAVPALSIAAGTAAFYAIQHMSPGAAQGATLSSIPSALPTPEYLLRFLNLFSEPSFTVLLVPILTTAFAMATLNSIATLISLVTLQSLSGKRFDANQELIGQGLGNTAAALFGGISAAGFVSRTSQNYVAGGRSRLSGVVSSVTVLILVMLLSDAFSFIPKAAFSGLVFVIGCQLVDAWSLREMKTLWTGSKRGNETILNVVILAVVIVLGTSYDLLVAVLAGIVISVLVFVVQMSRHPVRRVYSRRHAHSKKSRHIDQQQLLTQKGAAIVILELEGAIFFGSADNIATEIEALANNGAVFIILDLKRVVRIDSTAVRVIQQTQSRLAKEDRVLALSYVPIYHKGAMGMAALALVKHVGPENVFEDTDLALEHFEDELLKKVSADYHETDQYPLHQLLGLDVLDPYDAALIADYIDRQAYEDGDYVLKQGAEAGGIYFIVQGLADSMVHLPDIGRSKRLGTYTPGTYFGESALLDQKASPMNVVAQGNLVCFRITQQNFDKMKTEAPSLAMAILTTITRTLAFRMNNAIDMITDLER